MNKKDVDAVLVLDAFDKFASVEPQLQRLVESSLSGLRLFGSAWKQVAAEKLDGHIAEAQKELRQGGAISFESLRKIKEKALAKIAEISTLSLLPSRREVCIPWRDFKLKLVCRSHSEYLEASLQATLRLLAVDAGELPPLQREAVSGDPGHFAHAIAPELLASARHVRKFFDSLVAMEDEITGDTVLVLLLSLSDSHIIPLVGGCARKPPRIN